MIEKEISDWYFGNFTKAQLDLSNDTPWSGETTFGLLGPAGVGKTFALTQAIKSIEKEFEASTKKAGLTWDIMEVDRDTAEERLAFLENLIFSAKSRNKRLKFNNYAFALAAYARRRRPGLKAHESHPEFNRMRKAVMALGGSAGGAMLEFMDEVGLDHHFDAAIELIEDYNGIPDGFLSFARNAFAGLSGQGLGAVARKAGEDLTGHTVDRLTEARSAFRQRIRDLSERNGAVADPTKNLELMLPEAFALDCALNAAKGHNLQVIAAIDRVEAVRSPQTLTWVERLATGAPGVVWLMLGERLQDREDQRFEARFSVQCPEAGKRLRTKLFNENNLGVRSALILHEVPDRLWPRVEERAEGRPIYAKLWAEIFHRNYSRLGDIDQAADFYPTGQHIINYYLANMPESMRLQIELASLVPSMPIEAFYAVLESENIGEGAARPEDVRAIGRATAAEGRIEIHEELRNALFDSATGRRKRWLEGKQYQLSLWALHHIAIPNPDESQEDRAAYLGLFEGAALSVNGDRVAKLAVMVQATNFVTMGAVEDVIDLLRSAIKDRHQRREDEWAYALSCEAEILERALTLYDTPPDEEVYDSANRSSRMGENVLGSGPIDYRGAA
ncbi:hypothetical protein WNY61_19600 [Sulfitobacter sp. AS92]|uniref:hypothetical protein n=1 Tax=Sulfitobacter sp. AS92 TaxID=3135783 RepID=UPI00316CF6F4